MKFAFSVLVFAVLHFVVSFFVGFTAGITSSKIAKVVSTILTFPMSVWSEPKNTPGWVGWVFWAGISIVWGIGLTFLMRGISATMMHKP